MIKKSKKWMLIKELFSGWTVFFHLVFYYVIHAVFLYVLTKNMLISTIVAVPAAYLFFYSFSLIQRKIEKRQLEVQEINKYITSLTFYLNSGQNVPDALRNTLPLLHPILKDSVEKTLTILSTETRLDTSHFEKYHFTSLDLFHQTLLVKYEKGGKAQEMFTKPFQGVQFEISQIDDLVRKKKATAQQIYVMELFAIGIAGGMAFLPGQIYENFLKLPTSIFVILAFYGCLLYNVYHLQKDKADISLRF